MMKFMKSNKKKAFTLAEILLSLTVIGIVAAIALPSLLGNANERAWETQKKALHTRMAQAIPLLPSINGYGQLSSTTSGGQTTITDTAAETFLRDGLSKVIKITNICGITQGTTGADAATVLKDCGLPDKIIALDGTTTINLSSITTLGGLNSAFTGTYAGSVPFNYQQQDSNAAAFETANGESIIAYYYPECTSNMYENEAYNSQSKVCANFIYDLNGIKGPNTVGKDIGFMTAIYATDSDVVAPLPYPNATASIKQTQGTAKCKELYKEGRLPNIQEAISLFTNAKLMGSSNMDIEIWSSTSLNSTKAWYEYLGSGNTVPETSETTKSIICLKR